jgi:TusA-related sulfurtransferase
MFGNFVEIKEVLMELPHDRFLEAIVNDENLANIDFSEF